MLKVANIAVDHGKLRAVWNVALHIERGERVGLLGANGAGKSTTIGAILGLYRLAGGSIQLDDREIGAESSAARVASGIALVPEGRCLFPEMTVHENLVMGAYGKVARPGIERQLEAVHQLFPILFEKRLQRAGQLSGGQQQMVAIGRALMSSPRLLLLDEPFIGVAPLVVEEILAALTKVAQSGVTMLLVEQNVHRALEFVERAYVIENGRTVLEGRAGTLLKDEEFTAKFLGLD